MPPRVLLVAERPAGEMVRLGSIPPRLAPPLAARNARTHPKSAASVGLGVHLAMPRTSARPPVARRTATSPDKTECRVARLCQVLASSVLFSSQRFPANRCILPLFWPLWNACHSHAL